MYRQNTKIFFKHNSAINFEKFIELNDSRIFTLIENYFFFTKFVNLLLAPDIKNDILISL